MSSDILKISDLSVRFVTDNNTVFAVNGISYSIKEGEIVGIVGESGSGKSVSMLAVMGLLNQGTATVNGSVSFSRVRACLISPGLKLRSSEGIKLP